GERGAGVIADVGLVVIEVRILDAPGQFRAEIAPRRRWRRWWRRIAHADASAGRIRSARPLHRDGVAGRLGGRNLARAAGWNGADPRADGGLVGSRRLPSQRGRLATLDRARLRRHGNRRPRRSWLLNHRRRWRWRWRRGWSFLLASCREQYQAEAQQ